MDRQAAIQSRMDGDISICMFPSPGMGHLIPFVNLAKLLLSRNHITSATLILPSTTTTSTLLPSNIHIHRLPPLPLSSEDVVESQSPESEIFRSISLSLDSARAALSSLASSSSALVLDPFGIDLLDKAKELNLPIYLYFGTAAMNLLFFFHLPQFHHTLADTYKEFEDSPHPFLLPGCPPLLGRDFGDPFKPRNTPVFNTFLHNAHKSRSVHGILINTFTHLEPGAIAAFKGPPLFPIGPLVGPSQGSASGPVMDWMDRQPAMSVLYVSFGSAGTLSYEQTSELALGLEESGERFLWVVRPPNDTTSCPNYCSGGDDNNEQDLLLLGFLPEGFVERTRGRGLVVLNWAPQVAVLGHASTGGFLTHCGWNSALESVVHGVPMIAWPLYAEQRTNAVVLTQGLNVAVRAEGEGGGVVARGEVAKAVKDLMVEGDGLRVKVKEFKEEAQKALGEGGSSSLALNEFAQSLI